MSTKEEKVDSLKKVAVLLQSGTSSENMDLTSVPVSMTFIFGTGSDGITPFEYELVNKTCNEELVMLVDQTEVSSKFGHLAQFIMDKIETRKSFYLKARVQSVEIPENREVVQALADNVKHGEGCSCGCGCG